MSHNLSTDKERLKNICTYFIFAKLLSQETFIKERVTTNSPTADRTKTLYKNNTVPFHVLVFGPPVIESILITTLLDRN